MRFKLFIIALLAMLMAFIAMPATAAVHVQQSFLGGQGNLVLTNNTTLLYGQSNLLYMSKGGSYVKSLQTNTVVNELWNGPAIVDTSTWADANGNVCTNASIMFFMRAGVADLSTNTVVFTLVRSCDGTNFGTAAHDSFVFQWASPGLADGVVSTNLPSNFLVGTKKIRVKSIVTSNVSSGTNCVLGALKLTGWTP